MTDAFDVMGPSEESLKKAFLMCGINYVECDYLRPAGSKKNKSLRHLAIKLSRTVLAWRKIFSVSRNYSLVIGNNTGDALWAPVVRFAGKKYILWVHDDAFFKGLALSLRFTRHFVSHYVACSNSVHRALTGLLNNIPIDVIPNGLDDYMYKPHGCSKPLQIAWIGSMEDRKDPLLFVNAILQLKRASIEVKGTMVFKRVDASLEAKVRNLAREADINMAGEVPREEIQQILNDIHVLMVTSKSDPLPTVIIEAYRSGVPVIARDIPSLLEMISIGNTGFVFNDISQLPEVTKKLISNYAFMSSTARMLFEREYKLSVKRSRLLALTKIILEKH